MLWGDQCLQDAYEAFEDAHGWNTHAAGNYDDDHAAGYSANHGTGHDGAGFFLKRTFSGGFGGSDQATGGGSGNGSSTGSLIASASPAPGERSARLTIIISSPWVPELPA